MSPWTAELRQKTTALFHAGLDNHEIAAAIGLTHTQVSPQLKALGLKRTDPHLKERIGSPNARRNAAARSRRRGSIRPPPGCKPLERREPGECAWPYGELPTIVFCCKPVARREGRICTYCEDHMARMWRPKKEEDD